MTPADKALLRRVVAKVEFSGYGWDNAPVCPVCKTYKYYPNSATGRRHTPDCELKCELEKVKEILDRIPITKPDMPEGEVDVEEVHKDKRRATEIEWDRRGIPKGHI